MSAIYFVSQQTMLSTIPLTIVVLGGMFSERSGMVNTTLEGIVTMGVFTGILFPDIIGGRMSGQLQLLPAILISTATGAVFAFSHAHASINIKTSQTISGTALDTFAPAFAIFVVRAIQGVQQIQFDNTFQVESVPLLGNIPFLGPLLFRNTYIVTYLDIVILVLSILMLYRVRSGLRLRSCGEHPHTADVTGINVCHMQYADALISRVLGGLEGLVFVVSASASFNADVAGYRFLALAVFILGQQESVKIMWASLLFGFVKAVATTYSGIPFLAIAGIPSYAYKMIPYLVTLIVLVFTSGNSRVPRASGVSHDKGQR